MFRKEPAHPTRLTRAQDAVAVRPSDTLSLGGRGPTCRPGEEGVRGTKERAQRALTHMNRVRRRPAAQGTLRQLRGQRPARKPRDAGMRKGPKEPTRTPLATG